MADSVVQLKCGVKNDGWGKKGKDSLAARLWSNTQGLGPIDDDKTYSEMWIGTYPSNPSFVIPSGEPLQDYVKKNPQLIGDTVLARCGAEIPFLPKILSFNKALALQIHPDKALAEKLHEVDPKKFGDANHKPEIAVALSKFELFVGWKPLKDIEQLLKLKPLESYVPKYDIFDNNALRETCRALLSASPDTVRKTVNDLQAISPSNFSAYTYIPDMLARLAKQYSEFDNGLLVATLLMNYMAIEAGEAVCVPADSIHAYLHGDIFECMARSDNVINTGFCPSAERDNVDLFTRALAFEPHSAEEARLPKKKSQRTLYGNTDEYAPPFSEFNVLATHLGPSDKESHKEVRGPSLLIVTQGSGKMSSVEREMDVREGNVFFIGQGITLDFATDKGMSVYRAYAE